MNKQNILYSLIVIITFMSAIFGREILANYINFTVTTDGFKVAIFYLWWTLPTILVTGFLFGFKRLFNHFGLNKGFFTGLFFSLIAVSPMFVSSVIFGSLTTYMPFLAFANHTLFPGFFEEYLFRGFLFGLLFTKLRWGFIPASLLGAIIFGYGHIYQSNTFIETIGIFSVTAIASVWFAWLYIEWDKNLWVPVFLHILMNMSWVLTDVSENALGGLYVNFFRVITITLTIFITIGYSQNNGLKINRKNLLLNRKCS